MPRWVQWILMGVVIGGGTLGGAGIARAMVRGADLRQMQRAADGAISAKGQATSLPELTDTAYLALWPECPAKLDPGNEAHKECIRRWLSMRDVVASRLPPPSIKSPTGDDLPKTGPAADIRGWLEGLTDEQRTGLRDEVGARFYDPIVAAAAAGDDAGTMNAVGELRKHMDQLKEDSPFAAMGMYASLKNLLGDKLDVLIRLAQTWK